MILEVPQLEIFGVYERGIPNAERIVLRANRPVDLTNYAVLLGFDQKDSVYPFQDHFLWLGARTLTVPSWVFIYTGKGEESISQETHTKDPVYALYWGKPNVIFSEPRVVPALVHLANVIIGNVPAKSITDLTKREVGAEDPVLGAIALIQKFLDDQEKSKKVTPKS